MTLLGVVTLGVAGNALPARAVDNGTLGIRPSNESDFFHLTVSPGETLSASAIVTNHGSAAVVLDTYAVDGETSAAGAFELKSQADPRAQVGSWVHNALSRITVKAQSQLSMPFSITVPVGTKPGDYAGGLMIQGLPIQGVTKNDNGTPMRIDVVQRQGVRIYLKVAGTAKTSLSASSATWTANAKTVTLRLAVKNTGNTTLHPVVTAVVNPLFANSRTVSFDAPESVPPGTTVTLTARYPAAPLMQIARIHATIKSEAATTSDSTTVFAIPWQTLSVGLGMLLAIAFVVWRLVRFLRTAFSAIAAVKNAAAKPLADPTDSPSTPRL